ncbi:MAG: hypothetical protein ABH871_09205 [Pseudomonadota bacterium]
MNKIKILIALLATFIFVHASQAKTSDIRIVFWYPGEAGSTEEAQPVLDAFLDYLSQSMTSTSFTGHYYNTVEGGLDYIMKKKPKVGIVSFAAWMQNRTKLGNAKVMLATLPLPKGGKTERYGLMCTSTSQAPESIIFTSEPLELNYVKQNLFPDISVNATLEQTDQIFAKIKKIADGSIKASAILTPMETATLEKLDSPWTKSLKIIARSKPVPTARVVLFDDGWTGSEKLAEILLTASKDPKALEILEEMRLKGFGRAN